jgi:hypothetical protein
MTEYEFTVILDVPETTEEQDEALAAAGCLDGTISSRDGVAKIDFDREAPSLESALRSAVADIEKAACGIGIVKVEIGHAALVKA